MSDDFPVPLTAAPAPVEVAPPPAVEPETPPAEPPPAEPPKEEGPPELPKGVQRRIDRAVRQKYEAEARAKVAEEELMRYRAMQQQGQPQPADEVPTIDKFSNIEDYVTAKAKWVAREQIREAMEQNETRTRQNREQSEAAALASTWQERIEKAQAEIPDFEDVIGASQVPMSSAMERALVESEIGPKMAYWLAQNPTEAVKISQLPPTRAFAALGRIEERLMSAPPPPPPKPSNAPPPIDPVGTRSAVNKDPDSMSTAEWMAWRQKQLKPR